MLLSMRFHRTFHVLQCHCVLLSVLLVYKVS